MLSSILGDPIVSFIIGILVGIAYDYLKHVIPVIKIADDLVKLNDRLITLLYRNFYTPVKTNLVISFYNNKTHKQMANLKLGQPELEVILQLQDADTKEPIAATFTNPSYSIEDETIATLETDDQGVEEAAPVSAGSTIISAKATASYFDKNLQQDVVKDVSGSAPLTVDPADATAENVELVITLGAKPAPAATNGDASQA